MADDPRAVRLARRRMLITSKPKPKLTIPVRGSVRGKRGGQMKKIDATKPLRLRVRR